jgi:prolyl-tRNA editing enzyme YbaK/EbsC (Cys-tRNA(Pro) deacylase)
MPRPTSGWMATPCARPRGFPIGGVPPFGHSTQLRVFVDPDLLQYDEVWAAAGTWNDNFGAAPADIVRVAGGVVTDLERG